ncbi:PqqD family protein [Thermodesulfobacteriota bacterium]
MVCKLAKEYVWKEVGGQVVILHLDSGSYFSLNPTGSLVWKGVMEPVSLDRIVQRLCSSFQVDEETSRKDAEEIIQKFLDKEMIVNE